ncbi:MAG: VOC family protein [Streptomyces sp.]|uniref:VOC family protein n=1 Tax=Streptomyces sp. TaxID=1931 RepID=UPI003D6C2509
MPEVIAPYETGIPCWTDLMVPDQQAALDFYRDLFGWQGEIGPPETGGYAVCSLHGKAVAGIMATMAPEGQPTPPTAWTAYLATDDVNAATQAVSDNGGTVMAPAMDVMSLGRMAVAADSTGAVFGLWEARDFIGAQVVNEDGAVIWNELNTANPEAAKVFYHDLGIDIAPMEGAEGYFSLNAAGHTVGGMQGLDKSPSGTPSHWLTYFDVDDTDSTVDAVTRAGGSVLVPPFDMMAGRMAVVRDPQGATFAVINPTPPDGA